MTLLPWRSGMHTSILGKYGWTPTDKTIIIFNLSLLSYVIQEHPINGKLTLWVIQLWLPCGWEKHTSILRIHLRFSVFIYKIIPRAHTPRIGHSSTSNKWKTHLMDSHHQFGPIEITCKMGVDPMMRVWPMFGNLLPFYTFSEYSIGTIFS